MESRTESKTAISFSKHEIREAIELWLRSRGHHVPSSDSKFSIYNYSQGGLGGYYKDSIEGTWEW